MVQLKGSEKQIKWAEDIRTDLEKIYAVAKEAYIEQKKAEGKWDEKHAKHRLLEMEVIEREILGNDSAEFFIRKFGKYKKEFRDNDYENYLAHLSEDFAAVASGYSHREGARSLFGGAIARVYREVTGR